MEPIRHEPEFLPGYEVLNFGQVELEKVREDGNHTFATIGNLSIFYFDYFERFILQLNNWRYCLLPKLPTSATSQPGFSGRNFIMPAYDGTYTLKINQVMSPAALQNFETILAGATKFNREGGVQEFSVRPNQFGEIVQSQTFTAGQPGVFYEMPNSTGFSSYTGSTVSSVNNSDVKKSKLKMGFSNLKKKFKKKNKAKKEPNLNFTHIRDYQTIRATPASMVNVVDFKRQDIETAIVSTKEIIKKLEGPPASFKEEIKEKVVGFVDIVKEGVQEMRGKIAERHEHEAKTGEKIGIMEIVKEGIHEMRDKLNKKGPLEDGEILEPREGPGIASANRVTTVYTTNGTDATKPGIVETVKNEYYELKEKAAVRQALSGAPTEKVGIMDIVKEGVFEIKEKLAARKAAQEGTVVAERVETVIAQPGVVETRATRVIVNEPPRVYESHRTGGRLKIFDDKYLDKPIDAQPFPITGALGAEVVQNYQEYSRPVVTTVQYKELEPHTSIMDKLKANLPFSDSHHLPVKETHMPAGHASGNISDRIKDKLNGTSNTVVPIEPATREQKPGILDKVQMLLGTKEPPEDRAHSPVKKREFIKALIKSQPEEAQDQGRLLNMAHAGGLVGIAKAGGLPALAGVAGPILMKKKVDPTKQSQLLNQGTEKPGMMDKIKGAFGHSSAEKKDQPSALDKVKGLFTSSAGQGEVMEQATVIAPEHIHTVTYDQPVVNRHLPTQVASTSGEVYQVYHQETVPVQTTVIEQVQPATVVSEVYKVQESVPVQARVIDRRVVVNPESQISSTVSQAGGQVYEAQIAHYEC